MPPNFMALSLLSFLIINSPSPEHRLDITSILILQSVIGEEQKRAISGKKTLTTQLLKTSLKPYRRCFTFNAKVTTII